MNKNYRLLFAIIIVLALLLLPAAALADGPDLSADTAAAAAALDRHIESMQDKYCTYYTADEYRMMYQEYAGTFGGVGVSMIQDDDKYISIYKVLDMGPAKDSPIKAGDRIVAVDGENIVGLDTDQAALRIRGEVGTDVTLTILTPAGERYDVTLTRQEITTQSLEGQRIEGSDNVAYILIYSFTGQTVREFGDEYNRLRKEGPIDWLILDLRSNVGGNFFAALGVAELFIPAGDAVVREKLATGETAYASTSGLLQGTKVIVLQNEWTASASEVLAGALRDEAGATLIGTNSYGKGLTQVLEELPSGGCWKHTHSRYYTPTGFDLNGVGLTPDIEVKAPEGISNADYFSTDPDKDPHLKAALDFIQSQI